MSDTPAPQPKEDRRFVPSNDFVARARVGSHAEYASKHALSLEDPARFWAEETQDLVFRETWKAFSEWDLPHAKFFVGAKLNVSESCLDRHLSTAARQRAAIVFEGEPGDTRTLTYFELHRDVVRFAAALIDLGVKAGDRVAIYMGMVPELAIAMLACARIGATHSIVFGGFSADALRDRINDAEAKVVVTADGAHRRGTIVELKGAVDDAVVQCPSVTDVVVYRRTAHQIHMEAGRDHWWHELMEAASSECQAEPLDSEHPLYILYTSGTTGKPKGIVHTTGGYMVAAAATMHWVFDLKEDDTYWCTADIGWVTGHSYVIYGPLANGATTVMYEGAPNWPEPDRFWQIIEKYRVSIFYTAPTAIRAFVKWGEGWPRKHDLSSLRLLGTVGEPINPEAWMWYSKVIGGGRCPIVDTWWQTETGSIMISPLPGATPTKPGSATRPMPGVEVDVVDKDGNPVPANAGGYLVIRKPWPSMLRTIHGLSLIHI